MLENQRWIEGFGELKNHSLSFDLQLNQHQYKKAAKLIQKLSEAPVIINHLGTPTLKELVERSKHYWQGIETLASCGNVFMKISMLSYIDKDLDKNKTVTEARYRIIELFGIGRCFFASDFPVEIKDGWPLKRLYGTFRNFALAEYTLLDLRKHFSENAQVAYFAN